MMRILFCTVAVFLSAAVTGAGAGPLQIAPEPAVPSARTVQYYNAYVPSPGPAVPVRLRGRAQPAVEGPPKVYLLRGFMNVFSLGMDDLAEKLQDDGIAATVTNHADADAIVTRIVAQYAAGDRGPVILIGHSLGADAVIAMAQALDRYNVPVALAVLFDGTAPHQVPKNVATAVNFTKAFDLSPGPGFHGSLSNVDLRGNDAIDHLSIDKSPALQATTINDVLQAAAPVSTVSRRP